MVVKDGNLKINIKTSKNRQTGHEIKWRFALSLVILLLQKSAINKFFETLKYLFDKILN